MGIIYSASSIARILGYAQILYPSLTSSGEPETHYDEKSNLGYPSSHISSEDIGEDAAVAYDVFLKTFPEYQLTSVLDDLRASDFSRLDTTGETYVDYMGGALYPESLIRRHAAFLTNNVLGNTHSVSNR
jgi:hypothetical protein